jgi:hypothetical protein
MGDLTYESLMAARQAKTEETGEFDMMKMANLALNILEQVNRIKGNTGGNVMQSRPTGERSADAGQSITPKIDVKQILGALGTVKQLKGDIKITELETLLKEHKDQVESLLGQI